MLGMAIGIADIFITYTRLSSLQNGASVIGLTIWGEDCHSFAIRVIRSLYHRADRHKGVSQSDLFDRVRRLAAKSMAALSTVSGPKWNFGNTKVLSTRPIKTERVLTRQDTRRKGRMLEVSWCPLLLE